MTIKLSEAIMMNGMTKPQGFGPGSLTSTDAPCAIGGALQAIGKRQDYIDLYDAWPWVTGSYGECPEGVGLLCTWIRSYCDVIWHLNDVHQWTRAQIAKWVASVEPQEIPVRPDPTPQEISDQVQRELQQSSGCFRED